jgi:Histone methylation protein DOT1
LFSGKKGKAMDNKLQSLIAEMEQLYQWDPPTQLRNSIEILDYLEPYICDSQIQGDDASGELYNMIRTSYQDLLASTQRHYQFLRRQIQLGGKSSCLAPWISIHQDEISGEGYDYLDVLVNGIFQFTSPDGKIVELTEEMVSYQPTPARRIFELISRISLTEHDIFVDLGSGMGHVPLLVAICTEANCIGIELEKAYVDCARLCARGLNLANVTFIQQDARSADFSQGTVFYLYTPFTGAILRDVLDSLRDEASRREIRICTYGPCTTTVAKEHWLEAIDPVELDQIALFHRRN